MNSKLNLLITLVMCPLAINAAYHDRTQYIEAEENADNQYVTTAEVISTTALYEEIRISKPEYICTDETVNYSETEDSSGLAGTLVGGAAGGLLGNQVGKGHGKEVATVVGTLLGAVLGNNVASNKTTKQYSDIERHCERRENYVTERNLTGYQVEYGYQGRTYTTVMDNRPGNKIDIQVSIEPLGY